MRLLAVAFVMAMLTAVAWPQPAVAQHGVAPKGPLNTLREVADALRGCWKWPPSSEIKTGMELTVRVSFKRNGEIFGARITYQSRYVSDEERALYHDAMMQAMKLCSPLPVTEGLGAAFAGRPFAFRIVDTRKQRKV